MKPSRRSFSKAILAAPFVARAQQTLGRAHITVDTNRIIGDIDPKIYGNFVEHLGRCIDGGVFQEGSPLSDANGYRKDVFQAAKDLNVGLLRWPGGNFSSNYHWQDGIGPRDQRPPRLEMAWGTIESNRFGTHEFLQYADMLGTEPYICTNLGTGTWTEAQQWVEYCNFAGDTGITRIRKQNGRAQPWKVTYWGLGNEIDGPWQMGHRSADDYGKFALEAAKLMKLTDPNIKLIAAGSSNYGADSDWTGWNRTILQYLRRHADYLSLHMYVGNQQNNFGEFMASSVELDERTKTAEGIISAALSSEPRDRRIYVAWDEWNVWYRARGNDQRGRNILEEHYNLEDALVVSTFLNSFVNHSNVVKIANMAQLVNVIAPIFTNDTGMFLQTIYYPLQLFATYAKGKSLALLSEGPQYMTRRFGDVPYLDTSAAFDNTSDNTRDNGTLILNVTNRHPSQAITADVILADKQFSGAVTVREVNGPDIKAENDFTTTRVKTVQKSVTAQGKTLTYNFPAHSFTMLQVKLG